MFSSPCWLPGRSLRPLRQGRFSIRHIGRATSLRPVLTQGDGVTVEGIDEICRIRRIARTSTKAPFSPLRASADQPAQRATPVRGGVSRACPGLPGHCPAMREGIISRKSAVLAPENRFAFGTTTAIFVPFHPKVRQISASFVEYKRRFPQM